MISKPVSDWSKCELFNCLVESVLEGQGWGTFPRDVLFPTAAV